MCLQQAAPLAMLGALHLDRITDVAWSCDGRLLAAASYDGFCRCSDLWHLLHMLPMPQGGVER